MLLRNVHPIGKLFFKNLEEGLTLIVGLGHKSGPKDLSTTILPVRRWTSFMFDGGGMSSTTFILSEFAFIPWLLTIKPKNFPDETPKAHLAGFNFMLYFFRIWNASTR